MKFILNGLRWKKNTNAPITPIRLLPGDSSPVVVINTAATIGGEEIHSRGGGGLVRKDTSPVSLRTYTYREKKIELIYIFTYAHMCLHTCSASFSTAASNESLASSLFWFYLNFFWDEYCLICRARGEVHDLLGRLVSHSYVWHDSFTCATWPMYLCDMTHSCVTSIFWAVWLMQRLCFSEVRRYRIVRSLSIHTFSLWIIKSYIYIYVWIAWWTLSLPQTSRANPVQCYSTHQE